jgi:hypothetical protein
MKRPVRELLIADELWTPLCALAERLELDRDLLVRQALHAFLRFHGALPEPPASTRSGSRAADARHVLDTASELERAIPAVRPPPTLRLMNEAGLLATVTGERFLLGRGRHCDLVIDSAKVSREHAAIWLEPDGWWIEDLGSSNGTWFDRARIDRRRIEDGDVYLVCAERIRCLLS